MRTEGRGNDAQQWTAIAHSQLMDVGYSAFDSEPLNFVPVSYLIYPFCRLVLNRRNYEYLVLITINQFDSIKVLIESNWSIVLHILKVWKNWFSYIVLNWNWPYTYLKEKFKYLSFSERHFVNGCKCFIKYNKESFTVRNVNLECEKMIDVGQVTFCQLKSSFRTVYGYGTSPTMIQISVRLYPTQNLYECA